VPTDVLIRPLRPEDVPAAADVGWRALSPYMPGAVAEDAVDPGPRVAYQRARVAHLLDTDPAGCWVAEAGGEVVGVALGLVRDDVWGFSLFGLLPAHQGRGVGRDLLGAALTHAEGRRGGIILSSVNPAAMRSYFRAGFRILPTVSLGGIADPRAIPSGLRARPGDPDADAGTLDLASRHVRGASHRPDVPTMLGASELLVLEGEGFAVHREGKVALLAATSDAAARDLAWSCLAAAPRGGTVEMEFVSAGNDWAVDVGLRAGLSLSPEGPIFVRGVLGTLRPFIPNGAYL
jgi:GNAT superfamily N-acetyltransferase